MNTCRGQVALHSCAHQGGRPWAGGGQGPSAQCVVGHRCMAHACCQGGRVSVPTHFSVRRRRSCVPAWWCVCRCHQFHFTAVLLNMFLWSVRTRQRSGMRLGGTPWCWGRLHDVIFDAARFAGLCPPPLPTLTPRPAARLAREGLNYDVATVKWLH